MFKRNVAIMAYIAILKTKYKGWGMTKPLSTGIRKTGSRGRPGLSVTEDFVATEGGVGTKKDQLEGETADLVAVMAV